MANTTAAPSNASEPIFDAAALQTGARTFFLDAGAWLRTHWLEVLLAFAAGAILVAALHALRRLAGRLADRDVEGPAGWVSIIGRALVRTGNLFIVMLAVKLVVGYAGAPRQVESTVAFLWTVAAVFQGAVWAREIILGAIEHRTRSAHYAGEALLSAMGLIRVLVTFALFAIALVVVLDNLGVDVTGLVAGLGVGGIAIGLAAQGIFGDLFAALAIIFDRPFRRGDKVEYDQTVGTIEAIGLKSTRIRSFGGEMRVISNKQLLDKEIRNISDRDHVRVALTIRVPLDTPPEKLERLPALLTELTEAQGATVARAGFEAFSPSSLDYQLLFDLPGDDWPLAHATRDRLLVALLRRFDAEGIRLAHPTQLTYSAGPDGKLVLPYAPVQPVHEVGGP